MVLLTVPAVPDLLAAGKTVTELSAREQEVAGLIMQGFTYTQIGKELYISPNTVKSHWTRIYTKLGINTRRELFTTLKQPRLEQPRKTVFEASGAARSPRRMKRSPRRMKRSPRRPEPTP
jgi:DNA-binding CsgD family transcriptional regulator